MNNSLDSHLSKVPVVAIIRGVTPDEVLDIGNAIYESGIRVIEVPLNSPEPFESIKRLSIDLGEKCTIGCGTLLSKRDAKRVANAGGKIAVTPNTKPGVIKKCIELGMTPMPGWATPTEAFAAYNAGARHLKLFPASSFGSGHVKALKSVLPNDAQIFAVGGVGSHNAKEWLQAGIDGFGIGSDIYQAGISADEVYKRCLEIVNAIKAVS